MFVRTLLKAISEGDLYFLMYSAVIELAAGCIVDDCGNDLLGDMNGDGTISPRVDAFNVSSNIILDLVGEFAGDIF